MLATKDTTVITVFSYVYSIHLATEKLLDAKSFSCVD